MEELKGKFDQHLDDEKRFREELLNKINALNERISPISDTYNTVTLLGKWGMALAVFISIGIGIILSIRELIHK